MDGNGWTNGARAYGAGQIELTPTEKSFCFFFQKEGFFFLVLF
jgi:hypothetical protein